ncbi:MAG TPA: hypothetical protein VF190_13730 [Rhodothermales bacterium]
MSLRLVLLLASATLFAGPARAQLFSYDREAPRPTQAVAFIYVPVDFNYTGGGEPIDRFDFDDVAYGLQYTRPGLQIAVMLGNHRPPGATADEDLQLIDASLFTWGEIGLTRELSGGANRIFIPIALHSGHRRVAVEDEAETAIDAFSVTVIGIGTGVGFNLEHGMMQVVARATPAIGIATRSFGDATGSSTLFDGDVSLHIGPLIGRFGLHFGYAYRSQRWNVGSSDLLEDVAEDYFDYSGSTHLVRAGISF